MKTKVIFFGTPWIAKECLEELYLNPNVEIQAVVCQPDKEKNRKKEVVFSAVKQFAINHQLNLFQPEKIKDIAPQIKSLNPDIIITCAYGQFVNEEILMIPKYKAVNVHASLLPELRGGAPIHWAIIKKHKQTGITLMYMVKKMDAGNIIVQEAIDISTTETYSSLVIKLAKLARTMLKKHFNDLVSDNVKSIAQNENLVTFAYNITKEQEFIDFNEPADSVDAKIRGLNDKPLAKFKYLNEIYKVYNCTITNNTSNQTPGTIVNISSNGLEISTKTLNVLITKIQAPNKKPLEFKQLINGNHPFKTGLVITNE